MKSRAWLAGLLLVPSSMVLAWGEAPAGETPHLQARWHFGGPAGAGDLALTLAPPRAPASSSSAAVTLLRLNFTHRPHDGRSLDEGEAADAAPALWPYVLGAVAVAAAVVLSVSDGPDEEDRGNGSGGNASGLLCTGGECVIPCENSPDCFLD
jgi:hypothetical protein